MPYAKKVLGTVAYMGGVPAVLEQFAWSWGQLIQFNTEYMCNPDEIIHYDRASISLHAMARNSLAERMYGDWLLMLDTDHSFDPDILLRLHTKMMTYDLDVIVGAYTFKVPPYTPVAYIDSTSGYKMIGKWTDDVDLLRIDSAGAGCLLVRRKVFDRIRDELKEQPFDMKDGFGEDHSFFKRLERLEIPVFLHTKAECHHLEVRRLSLKDSDTERVLLSEQIEREGY